jgi:hypothetical protein
MSKTILFIPLLMLAACSGTPAPITNNPNPIPDIVGGLNLDPAGNLKTDLVGTAANLDGATAIGIIPPTLPLAACQHDINQFLGVEVVAGAPAVQSFQPVNDGPISLGSIAVIELLKLQQMTGSGLTIPQDCYTVIGYFQIMSAANILHVAAPVLPSISPVPVAAKAKLHLSTH